MGGVSRLLEDGVVLLAKKELKRLGRNGLVARKLEAVISAKKHGIKKVAEVYDISRTSLTSWIKHLRNGNIERLQAPPERRKKSILNEDQRAIIKSWINDDSQLTIDMVQAKIEESFVLRISRATTHREMKKLDFAYITPRPRHFKQDPNQVAEFKKKYSRED
jgi:transposase